MPDVVCPRGHLSTEPDFCSECGLRITPPAAAAPVAAAPAPTGEPCPDCGTPRVVGARFCEVCRHNFVSVTGTAQPSPASTPPLVPPSSPFAAPPSPAAVPAPKPPLAEPVFAGSGNVWVVVSRDPDRPDAETSPEPDRAYPLDLAENLVGRRNARRDVHPEIPVADPSVSARHLKICRRPDGTLYGVDVGSSNGTSLNGTALSEGVEATLEAGDRLSLGAYTLLTLEAR